MFARPDRPFTKPAGVMNGTAPFLAFAIIVTPWNGLSSQEPAPRPPSSIEPRTAKQQVILSHVHRRVRACTAIPAKSPTACAAQLSDTAAGTTLFLEPIAMPNGAPSRNSRVVVTFPEGKGLQKQTIQLPVGEWTIEWPGCREMGRLVISADRATAPRVALRTTTGGCELSSSKCRLLEGVIDRNLSVEP
jgi:hypothetical protein